MSRGESAVHTPPPSRTHQRSPTVSENSGRGLNGTNHGAVSLQGGSGVAGVARVEGSVDRSGQLGRLVASGQATNDQTAVVHDRATDDRAGELTQLHLGRSHHFRERVGHLAGPGVEARTGLGVDRARRGASTPGCARAPHRSVAGSPPSTRRPRRGDGPRPPAPSAVRNAVSVWSTVRLLRTPRELDRMDSATARRTTIRGRNAVAVICGAHAVECRLRSSKSNASPGAEHRTDGAVAAGDAFHHRPTDRPVEDRSFGARVDQIQPTRHDIEPRCVDAAMGQREPDVHTPYVATEKGAVLMPVGAGVDGHASQRGLLRRQRGALTEVLGEHRRVARRPRAGR